MPLTPAAVAGARDGDVCASIKRLWHEITLKPLPYWPSDLQATFSLFGNPGFWRTRNDFHRYSRWTNLYDNSPMYETLIRVCDFDRLNNPSFIRLAVTATNVQTGDQVSFSNYAANPDALPLRNAAYITRQNSARPHHRQREPASWLSDDGHWRRALLGRRTV